MKGARNHGPSSSATDYCDHPTSSKALSQTVIETVQQTRNCLFGFVAHIGEAEGCALNFAVAGFEEEMMFSAQILRYFRNVDALIEFHAWTCLSEVSLFCSELESGSCRPIVR